MLIILLCWSLLFAALLVTLIVSDLCTLSFLLVVELLWVFLLVTIGASFIAFGSQGSLLMSLALVCTGAAELSLLLGLEVKVIKQ